MPQPLSSTSTPAFLATGLVMKTAGAGVEDEVERPLAVDLGPDEDVLGIGQLVGDLEFSAGTTPQQSARVIRQSIWRFLSCE